MVKENPMANNPVIRMKELIAKIKEADIAYFRDDAPKLSDREYDALVEELKGLEDSTGVVFSGSPTRKVSGEVKDGLKTVRHTKPMLSAEKTKSILDIESFAEGRDIVLSWKLDGLSLILRYENGNFTQAVTRGSDGITGEDVTHTVRYFRNIPHKVSCLDSFEVRGEGVISWTDFEAFEKREMTQTHPRNFASGAVRSLAADKGKCSHLDFIAFEYISEDEDVPATKAAQLDRLSSLGFSVVPYKTVAANDSGSISSMIKSFEPESFEYPVDGIVAEYDDIAYGKSLGATAHHENNKIALKWQDELFQTVFRGVELITTRTGAVSIVVIFDPVLIDGSRVKRASIPNLGIFESFKFGLGDTISVYKANMIIPQIAENLTKSGTYTLPSVCPCCGERLEVKVSTGGTKQLFCPNKSCIARNAQKIARFCDKTAMNIEGLSAVMLEKLMANGWIKSYADLFHLDEFRDDIASTHGFGIASYEKMHQGIERSRNCKLSQFLVGVGIPLLGPQAANILEMYFYGSWESFEKALGERFAFSHIEGISGMLEKNIYKWYEDKDEEKLWRPVLKELHFNHLPAGQSSGNTTSFYGLNVVVTGTITGMTRKQITEVLTLMGASVSESVSAKTDVLIVGAMPGGNKLGSAMKNGTKIITERDFAELLQK